ncbi:hypothetical protein S7335_1175 [Synechococcus sp. PCC 7335]|uniref:hypothetical protein n=1 Tax=Synechococcus sp. (strain ATCC 29403 / PCC 7335) TaxID=91464 RepID=UPI00017EB574|nr:hypothetical protein [Synechococcus sp. PCC 7335]EDX82471.1 hypothetical protein S7335_1175 [Synechococcus sp. PCC 7335]
MGVRGPQKSKGALRRNGWRPSCTLPPAYKNLVGLILKRSEFKDKTTGDVFCAALREIASEEELKEVDL